MLVDNLPFLIFYLCLCLEIRQKVGVFLGAVEETELLVDDSQFTSCADAAGFEHDFLVVIKLELVFWFADEV